MFNGEKRILAYEVPYNYNSSYSVDLVIALHSNGDNALNYRDTIINRLLWHTYLQNTIFVFPDGGDDENRDFYSPKGDEQIINEALNSALSLYPNINRNRIFIQGFSYGGRSALKFGLDNYESFKGIVLNSPAIQGVFDLNNDSEVSLEYAYQNSTKIPIGIEHSIYDYKYLSMYRSLEKRIIDNNGLVYRFEHSSVPHKLTGIIYLYSGAFNFVKRPVRTIFDLHFVELKIPQRTCQNNVTPELFLRNLADTIREEIFISLDINGQNYEYVFDINLNPFQNMNVQLDNDYILNEGGNIFEVTLYSSSKKDDYDLNNNKLKSIILKNNEAIVEPISMGFNSGEDYYYDWIYKTNGNLIRWRRTYDVAGTDKYSLFTFNTIHSFKSKGLSEDFLSPFINLSKMKVKNLHFDYAFNYHKYTPPYFNEDMTFSDTLKIYISNDCGETYDLLFEEAGEELATTDEPIINPIDINSSIFIPNEEEWRTINIDLTDYSFETNSILKFSLVSGQGGTIYLDNINIGDVALSVESLKDVSFNISPNPVHNELSITDENYKTNPEYTITNISGEIIGTYNSNLINVDELSSGTYFISKMDKGKKETAKFIKE